MGAPSTAHKGRAMIDSKMVSSLSQNPLVLVLVFLAGLIYLDDDKEVARRMTGMEAQIQVLNERTGAIGAQVQVIQEIVEENGRQIRALSEQIAENRKQIAENGKQIAILSERITRLHPELSAKR